MLLRASSEHEQGSYNLNSVTEADTDPGVPCGPQLRELTEAAIYQDWLRLAQIRPGIEQHMGKQQVVDTLTVAAAFNGITRVADATGIPLDRNTADITGALREDTGIQRFDYSEKSARYD